MELTPFGGTEQIACVCGLLSSGPKKTRTRTQTKTKARNEERETCNEIEIESLGEATYRKCKKYVISIYKINESQASASREGFSLSFASLARAERKYSTRFSSTRLVCFLLLLSYKY